MPAVKPKRKPAASQTSGAAPKSTGIGLLRLKLGACLTGPSKRLRTDLLDVATQLIAVRNAEARAWRRWHEDHPGFAQMVPALVHRDTGALIELPAPLLAGEASGLEERERLAERRREWARQEQAVGFSTYLGHVGRREAPHLDSQIIFQTGRETYSYLKAKTPYNHQGEAKYRWQAILANEVSIATSRALAIPVLNNKSVFVYGPDLGGTPTSRAVEELARQCGKDSCVLVFPLFSPSFGRRWNVAAVRLEVRQLPAGQRRILRLIARKQWKFQDSEIVFKPSNPNSRAKKRGVEGDWYFHLTYQQPPRSSREKGGAALLTLEAPEAPAPFRIEKTRGEDAGAHWQIGHGKVLEHVHRRLTARRLEMRGRYRVSGSGRRGHGRQRIERDIRPVSQAVQNLARDVLCKAVAEVVRFCERFDVGTLRWQEPTDAAKAAGWFARKDLPCDWTQFQARLAHQCWLHGVVLES